MCVHVCEYDSMDVHLRHPKTIVQGFNNNGFVRHKQTFFIMSVYYGGFSSASL